MKKMDLSSRRPEVTMFMLMSVDGKISTGPTDDFDFDLDISKLPYAKRGLHQYYDLEKETSLWTMSSGTTKAKVLREIDIRDIHPVPASAIVVDTHHIDDMALRKLAAQFQRVVLVSTQRRVFQSPPSSVTFEVIPSSDGKVPVKQLLEMLYRKYDVRDICLQGGASLNASFLAEGLVDFLDIVVVPIVVGGRNTPTLVDGDNPTSFSTIGELELLRAEPLQHNYLRLCYKVLK